MRLPESRSGLVGAYRSAGGLLRDRFERRRIRHAIVDASLTGRFGRLPGQYTRIAVGGATG